MSISQKRAWLAGLALRCPFSAPLDSCPLGKLRQLDESGRVAFIDRFGPGHVERILERHRTCLLVRQATERAPGLFDLRTMESKVRACQAKSASTRRNPDREGWTVR